MPNTPDEPIIPDIKVSCEICEKEVPLSEASIREAEDYVLYFCGLECYEDWHKKAEHESDENK